MSFDIPAGLTDLLQDFTVAVLREKPEPSDLVNFAADYFNNLCSNKNYNNVTQSQYNEQYSMGEPLHESMQTESDDSDDEPFGLYSCLLQYSVVVSLEARLFTTILSIHSLASTCTKC